MNQKFIISAKNKNSTLFIVKIVNYPFQIFKLTWLNSAIVTEKISFKKNTQSHRSLMKLDEFTKAKHFQFEQKEFYESLTLKEIAQTKPQEILKIILEKDKIIQAFSQEITRFKADQFKAKKLIASLQQKIQKTLPSATNTSSSFMIPSEFKALFTTFMTSTVPSVFYDFTQNPKLYSLLLRGIMESVYQKLIIVLVKKMDQIRSILIERDYKNVEQVKFEESQKVRQDQILREQIRYHLLKFLQNYCQKIFPSDFLQSPQTLQKNQEELNDDIKSTKYYFKIQFLVESHFNDEVLKKIETLNFLETQKTDEIKQFCMELYKICLYMILQQNPWEFAFDTQNQQHTESNSNEAKLLYSKKEFTCIDGFVKEGNKVEMVVRGLKRKQNSGKDYHFHPNIKNFVLPFNKNEQETSCDLKFKTEVFFLDEEQTRQREEQSLRYSQHLIKLEECTNTYQNHQKNITNPLCLPKTLKFIVKAPRNEFQKNQKISLSNKKSKIASEQSFIIEAVAETEKSQIIESMFVQKQTPIIHNQSNCIVDSTQSYTLMKRSKLQCELNGHEDKENVSKNVNRVSTDKKISNDSKKEKSLLQKNMKKHKKEKNSTNDLTSQKHKTNQKDHLKESLETDAHKKRHDELPLTREIPKFSKKKVKGNSGRKCSVGKIVSQSTQMAGSKIHGKQKISLSQHTTVVMKQASHTKAMKDNYINEGSQRVNVENKENLMNFIGHLYEKQIIRPKKSTKINKNDEKPLLGENQAQKQERPLVLRAYQNNCLVGKLREKYLIG